MSLGLHYTILDFDYIPTDSLTTFIIHDKSIYLDKAENPMLQIIVPGYVTSINTPYNPKELTILNSHNLGLTLYNDNFTKLPDGVYEIIQMVCPYDKLFIKKYILRDNLLKDKLYNYLSNLDDCKLNELKKHMCDFNLFLEGAKANAYTGNVKRANDLYKRAEKILNNLTSC